MGWTINRNDLDKMREHCVEGFPLEACGLFIGKVDNMGIPTREITSIWPATNIEKSARIYSVDSKDMFEATKFAATIDQEIVGVYHSHTHSQAYPSPTDVAKAVDPNWLYAIVSLEKEIIDVAYFEIKGHDVISVDVKAR